MSWSQVKSEKEIAKVKKTKEKEKKEEMDKVKMKKKEKSFCVEKNCHISVKFLWKGRKSSTGNKTGLQGRNMCGD